MGLMKKQSVKQVLAILMIILMAGGVVACSKKATTKDMTDKEPQEEMKADPVITVDDQEESEAVEEAETVEEVADTSSGLDIAIDPKDIKFSWGSDDYGKNGWVFTSTGTMKMEIPEGWEVQIALHESQIGVRSDSQDGDIIAAAIEDYSTMIKDPADRTPENQAKERIASGPITQDRWGNADVWYGVTEWTDYTAIAGYAAYSDEECVAFDIRAKKVNGSLEELMASDAWNTFKTTFEIQAP